MATTLVLAALSPVAGAQESDEAVSLDGKWRCVPSEDRSVTRVSTGTALYYIRSYGTSAYTIEEVWQEVNGEAGLQLTSSMSCVGKADRFVKSACVGLCPITL